MQISLHIHVDRSDMFVCLVVVGGNVDIECNAIDRI